MNSGLYGKWLETEEAGEWRKEIDEMERGGGGDRE